MTARLPGLFIAPVLALILASGQSARAENINEFNLSGVKEISHQASRVLLNGIVETFKAIAVAEDGDANGANGRKREAVSLLRRSQELYQKLVNEMKATQKINYEKVPPNGFPRPLPQILERHGYRMPQTTTELASIALKELEKYLSAVEPLQFGVVSVSRLQLLVVNDRLHSVMELGIVISQLSDTAIE